MSNSALATIKVPAHSSNYTKGRSGKKINKIAVHHMAGVLTAKQCGNIFAKANRNASAHYGVGKDGDIALFVDEANTAWTNSNWNSNCESVTMELSNSSTGGKWPVGDKTLNSAIKLMADIAKRNKLGKLVKGKNVVWHSMYVATTCPGPYLLDKLEYMCHQANIINGYEEDTKPGEIKEVNYIVQVTTDVLNVRKEPSTSSAITTQIKDRGAYTIIAETKNEGMTWGKLKSGMGWISLEYTEIIKVNTVTKPAPQPEQKEEPKPEVKEEPKVEEPKVEEPKQEEVKKEEPVVETPTTEQPKVEEPKQEEPQENPPVVEQPIKSGFVNAPTGINIRNLPEQTGTRVGALTYETKVDIYEEKNGWGRIGPNQWVNMSFITVPSETKEEENKEEKTEEVEKLQTTFLELLIQLIKELLNKFRKDK